MAVCEMRENIQTYCAKTISFVVPVHTVYTILYKVSSNVNYYGRYFILLLKCHVLDVPPKVKGCQ